MMNNSKLWRNAPRVANIGFVLVSLSGLLAVLSFALPKEPVAEIPAWLIGFCWGTGLMLQIRAWMSDHFRKRSEREKLNGLDLIHKHKT